MTASRTPAGEPNDHPFDVRPTMRPLIKWPVMWFQVSTPDLPCAVPELLGMPPSMSKKAWKIAWSSASRSLPKDDKCPQAR